MAAPINFEANWRDSARTVRFFFLDGKAAFPLLIFFVHVSWVTFIIAFVFMVFFSVLNRYGCSPIVFFRLARNFIGGYYKTAMPEWMK